MRVASFKRICTNPKIHELLAGSSSRDRVRSKGFTKQLLDTKQEELFRAFLGCLYENRDTGFKNRSTRLFKAFYNGFYSLPEEEKKQFSDPFHKEMQHVASVYVKRTSSLDGKFEDASFRLKDLKRLLKKLQKDDYKLAAKQEAAVNKYSLSHDGIRRGVEEFQQLNNTDYPHSVLQLDHSPKMVILGVPRMDREDTLNRFFSVMIEEEVDVIVALNTVSDWEEAIAYYDLDQIKSVKIKGYVITCGDTHVLYEGHRAANMPQVQEGLVKLSKDKQQDLLVSDKYKKYRPRVVERTFFVTEYKSGYTKKITQLHYENWPDRSAAPDLDAWWILFRRQLELQKGTLAIHCQGGIGRTNAHAILTCLVSEINALKDAKAELERAGIESADLAGAIFNVPLTMLRLKEQAPRLGGFIVGERFYQIYEMLNRYYAECN